MIRLQSLVPILFAASLHADELILETKPFTVTHVFDGAALPQQFSVIQLDAKAWPAFEIEKIASHGSMVKKGDSLLVLDAEDIDKKIEDLTQGVAKATLDQNQAKSDLATLEKTVPEQLARLKRSAAIAAEELEYFKETRRKSSEEVAAQSLKRQEQLLASYQEELKQLLQMYEADDITEETEEIILQKQRDSVAYAEFALRMERLKHARTLSVDLPREETSLIEKRDDSALQLAKGNEDLPRSLEMKKLEVAALEDALKKNREALADLREDRKLFDIKAPSDGYFYYGIIEDGKWTTGDLVKGLNEGGVAPVKKGFATFFPSTSKLAIHSFLKQEDALALPAESKGVANVAGLDHISIPVALSQLSATPNPDGSYGATLEAAWPEGFSPVSGQQLKVRMVSYSTDQAISIPSKALDFGQNGWTVEVKLADAKTERRAVTRGRISGENTEITEGLEAGQVVIVP